MANWLGFVASVVVTFFMSPLLVHGLGERAYGVWALVDSVLAYLALFDFGIGIAVVRYVARFHETREIDELNQVFSTSVTLFLGLGTVALAIVLTIALAWQRPLGVPEDAAHSARWLLVLLGINLAIGLPLGVYDSVLCAMGHYPLRTVVHLVMLGLRTAVMFRVVQSHGDLLDVGVTITVFGILQHVVLAVAAHLTCRELRFSPRFVTTSTFRTIRGYSLWALVAMVAGRIAFSTDAIVIGAFMRPEHITFFAVAARLVEYCKNGLNAFTGSLTPAMSALHGRGDMASLQSLCITACRASLWIIMPIQLGLWFFGAPFLSLWLGDGIAAASFRTLAILAAPMVLSASQAPMARMLYGMGQLRWFALNALAMALANLTISVALVSPMGIEGVALGTAISTALANLSLCKHSCATIGLSVRMYVRQAIVPPLIAAVALSALWLALLRNEEPRSWGALCLYVALGLACYIPAGLGFEYRRMALETSSAEAVA